MATSASSNLQWQVYFGVVLLLFLAAGFSSLKSPPGPEPVPGQFETVHFQAVINNFSLSGANSDRYALTPEKATLIDASLRAFLQQHFEKEPFCAQRVLPILNEYVRFYQPSLRDGLPVVDVSFAHKILFKDPKGKLMPLVFPAILDGGTEQFLLTYAVKEQRVTQLMFTGLRCNELNFRL